MFFAAVLAAAVLHAPAPLPAVQLTNAEHAATFHVVSLPSSMELVHAEAARDGSQVRLDYAIEGADVTIDERPPTAADSPNNDAQAQLFKCPCHGGVYDRNGAVVAGPPPAPLATLATRVDGDDIFVQA